MSELNKSKNLSPKKHFFRRVYIGHDTPLVEFLERLHAESNHLIKRHGSGELLVSYYPKSVMLELTTR